MKRDLTDTMPQIRRASAALQPANDAGALDGVLAPAVFGCPYGHTARIVTSPLPFGRCARCDTPLALLDRDEPRPPLRRAG